MREEKYIQDFGGETWGTDHLQDPDEDWILIKWILKEIQWAKVASIRLSQITDTLRAVVTTVPKLRVSYNTISSLAKKTY
jgi:hypothetical protein